MDAESAEIERLKANARRSRISSAEIEGLKNELELVRDWKAEKKDLEEAFDIIADKLVKADAEIEGLKARVEALRQIIEEDKALITELCDALSFFEPLNDNAALICYARCRLAPQEGRKVGYGLGK